MMDKKLCSNRKEYLWNTEKFQKENAALYIQGFLSSASSKEFAC